MKTIVINCKGLSNKKESICHKCPMSNKVNENNAVDCNLSPEDRNHDIKIKIYCETEEINEVDVIQ